MLIKHFARPLSTLSRKTGRKATSGAARASASSSPSPPHPPPLQEPVAYPLRRSPKFRHVSCEVASSDLCREPLRRHDRSYLTTAQSPCFNVSSQPSPLQIPATSSTSTPALLCGPDTYMMSFDRVAMSWSSLAFNSLGNTWSPC